MVKENLIPKTETVYELKSEIPTFEEFMKTYESDEGVNYDDLSYSDISDKGKGYEPCYSIKPNCTCFVNQSPQWIQLYMRCPGINEGTSCKNPEVSSWIHNNCDYPVYISTELDIKCIMCDRPSHMTN